MKRMRSNVRKNSSSHRSSHKDGGTSTTGIVAKDYVYNKNMFPLHNTPPTLVHILHLRIHLHTVLFGREPNKGLEDVGIPDNIAQEITTEEELNM